MTLGAEHAGHLERMLDTSVPENRLVSCEWQTSERSNVDSSTLTGQGVLADRAGNRELATKMMVFFASQAGLSSKPRGAGTDALSC